jgi:1-deoxy-D-xylulose-5-phosphate synthase
MTPVAQSAAELLAEDGVSVTLVDARWVKPLDLEIISSAASGHRLLVTVEENTGLGGFGAAVLEALSDLGLEAPVLRLSIPDCFVTHGATSRLLDEVGLTPEGIRGAILGRLLDLPTTDARETITDDAPAARRRSR